MCGPCQNFALCLRSGSRGHVSITYSVQATSWILFPVILTTLYESGNRYPILQIRKLNFRASIYLIQNHRVRGWGLKPSTLTVTISPGWFPRNLPLQGVMRASPSSDCCGMKGDGAHREPSTMSGAQSAPVNGGHQRRKLLPHQGPPSWKLQPFSLDPRKDSSLETDHTISPVLISPKSDVLTTQRGTSRRSCWRGTGPGGSDWPGITALSCL